MNNPSPATAPRIRRCSGMDASKTAAPFAHRGWRARWGSILVFLFRVMTDPDTSPRCAAAAFFGFLSFFPGIGTLTLIYGIVANRALVAQTVDAFRYVLPPMGLEILDQQLQALAAAPHATLGLGLLIVVPLALWSGSRGIQSLLFALSRVRGVPERRHFIVQILVSIGATLGGSLFLAVALAAIAVLPALLPFYTTGAGAAALAALAGAAGGIGAGPRFAVSLGPRPAPAQTALSVAGGGARRPAVDRRELAVLALCREFRALFGDLRFGHGRRRFDAVDVQLGADLRARRGVQRRARARGRRPQLAEDWPR